MYLYLHWKLILGNRSLHVAKLNPPPISPFISLQRSLTPQDLINLRDVIAKERFGLGWHLGLGLGKDNVAKFGIGKSVIHLIRSG